MKTTMKLALLFAMLCTAVLAGDGNQGTGGRNCDPNVEQCGEFVSTGGDTFPGFGRIFAVAIEEASFFLSL